MAYFVASDDMGNVCSHY